MSLTYERWKENICEIFSFTDLSQELINKNVTLINLSICVMIAAFLWVIGALSMWFFFDYKDVVKFTIPVVGYMILAALNMVIFYFTRNINVFMVVLFTSQLLSPLVSHVCIGGYVKGSGIILAAVLAPLGAAIFMNQKAGYRFFGLFVIVLIIGGVLEYHFPDFRLVKLPPAVNLVFFILNYIFISLIFLVILNFFLREKDKIKALLEEKNTEISKKNYELNLKKEKISTQRDHLEDANQRLVKTMKKVDSQSKIIKAKNDSITESINYARNLQQTILASPEKVSEIFSDNFIIYLPKAIVSGDFYWFYTMDDHVFFAVADCTGHGVPGAFISILCSNLLHLAVVERQLTNPGLILTEVNRRLKIAFDNKAAMFQASDGMDISLCHFKKGTKKLYFAGACNSLFKVSPDGETKAIKGNRRSVGRLTPMDFEFETRSLEIQQVDMIYLYSDGYKDQFKEKSDEKFKSKHLKALLRKNAPRPCPDQMQALLTALNNWKGADDQIDDITVFGVRIP